MINEMLERFEIVAESDKKIYYASSKGYILSVSKSDYSEKKLKNYLKTKRKNPPYVVKIDGKERIVKHLIAKAFLIGYKESDCCVLHKDGNKANCAAYNLIIVPKRQVARITGAMSKSRSIAVFDSDGNNQIYGSIRKVALALNVSHQTLIDYMRGTHKHSVLDGCVISYV